jgi:ribonuclease P protein component
VVSLSELFNKDLGRVQILRRHSHLSLQRRLKTPNMSLKILQIKKSSEFQKISKQGQKFHSKTVLLLSLPTSQFYFQNSSQGKNAADFCRVGYTVAKTVSKLAVVRNQAKRRLREAFRSLCLQYAKNHFDYVLIAKREIKEADFEKIFADLKFCLKRIHQMPSASTDKSNSKK